MLLVSLSERDQSSHREMTQRQPTGMRQKSATHVLGVRIEETSCELSAMVGSIQDIESRMIGSADLSEAILPRI